MNSAELERTDLAKTFLSFFCTAMTLAALLPVLPLFIRDATGGSSSAGFVTGAVAVGAVALELSSPWLLRRATPRFLQLAGLTLMSLALAPIAAVHSLILMTVLGLAYGAGFGVNVTLVSALVGRLGSRRGRALGLYGLIAGVPTIVAPPLALAVEARFGARPVIFGVALVALLGNVPLLAVRARTVVRAPAGDGFWRTVNDRSVLAVVAAYVLITLTYGAVVSFTPFVLSRSGVASAAIFLFLFGLFRTLARAAAGPLVTHATELRVTSACLVAVAVGLALIAVDDVTAVVAAAILYGIGYGIIQTATFVAILGRATANINEASSLWNLAVDGGTGLGALTLAPLGAAIGYRALFLLLPTAPAIALAARLLESRRVGVAVGEFGLSEVDHHGELGQANACVLAHCEDI